MNKILNADRIHLLQKDHWEDYYNKDLAPHQPTSFAVFIDNYITRVNGKTKGELIEFGCGNGRDATYFASKEYLVDAIDLAQISINNLKTKFKGFPNINFIHTDFTKLELIEAVNKKKFAYAYSRFTLHAIPKTDAALVLAWASKNLKSGGLLFIEARSVNSSLYGKGELVERDAYVFDHYRRFIRKDELINDLTELNFNITYEVEDKGLAVYKDDDPVVIRIIAQKG